MSEGRSDSLQSKLLSLSSYIWGYFVLAFLGGGEGVIFHMALMSALPASAHELLLQNPLFHLYFYTVVWRK